MAGIPLSIDGVRYTHQGATASSLGTEITNSASANTKGSWIEIEASTDHEADAVLVHFLCNTLNNFLFDFGIGGAGNEQVLLSNFLVVAAGLRTVAILLPIRIPEGTRLVGRCQASAGSGSSGNGFISVQLIHGGLLFQGPLTRVETCGANTADSGGTSVDSGAGAGDTKGAYSQLIASTSFDYKMLFIVPGNANDYVRPSSNRWLLDIAVGAAASEQVIIPNLQLGGSDVDDVISPLLIGPIPINIPAGSRIAARAQCVITTADRLIDVIVYGIG